MNLIYPGLFGFSWIVVYCAAVLIVHLFFALGVLRDTERRYKLLPSCTPSRP